MSFGAVDPLPRGCMGNINQGPGECNAEEEDWLDMRHDVGTLQQIVVRTTHLNIEDTNKSPALFAYTFHLYQ